MKTEIRIEIQNASPENDAVLFSILLLTVPVGILLWTHTGSRVWLSFALLIAACCFAFRGIRQSRKTVVKSDGETLWWQQFGKPKMIRIADIAEISCKPYEVQTRFGRTQRIRLTLQTDGNPAQEIEFTDSVDSSQLLSEKIGSETEIPLAKLYRYLRERRQRE